LLTRQFLPRIRPRAHSANVLEYADGRLLVTYFCGSYEGAEDQITVGFFYDARNDSWSDPNILLRAFEFEGDRWVTEQVAAIENAQGETIIYAWACPFSGFGLTIADDDTGRWLRSIASSKLFRFHWDGRRTSAPECLYGLPGMEERGLAFQGRPLLRDPQRGPAGGWIIPYFTWLGQENSLSRFLLVEGDGVTFEYTGQDLYKYPGCVEPALARISNEHWLCFMRYYKRGEGLIWRSESNDGGRTFSEPVLTNLRNPHSAIDICYNPEEQNLLLAYNDSHHLRTPLTLAISRDLGRTFLAQDVEMQEGEYSYPKLYRTRDGQWHLFYTHKRLRIGHIRFETDWLYSGRQVIGMR
jgi:predicted neuraminidase